MQLAWLVQLAFPILAFWLAASVVGWVALPIARWLLGVLPGRGLAFAKPLGLLLTGYVFWLGVTFGVLPNSSLGAVVAVAAVAVAGAYLAWRSWDELVAEVRERARLLVGLEVLFLVGLVAWAVFRAYTPNIESAGGEKYMEMAFINAVLGSERFPPADPWLSGFAISYYYFAYVQAAMLIHLTGVSPSVAFNLMVPLTLGLTLVAAFGLGHDLVAFDSRSTRAARALTGALAALLLPLMGSLVGAVELGFMQGWGPPRLYQWLDIRDLVPGGLEQLAGTCGEVGDGYGSGGLIPSRYIWWWRGSRVITDVDPASGVCHEIIHEFPFFSFMLGDVHPHVVALPYVVTVVAIALAVLAGAFDRRHDGESGEWRVRLAATALVVGSLGFLNTWDLPTFGGLVVLAYGFRAFAVRAPRFASPPSAADLVTFSVALAGVAGASWKLVPHLLSLRGVAPDQQPLGPQMLLTGALVLAVAAIGQTLWSAAVGGDPRARRALDVARFAVWLVALAVALYLPFYIGLSSQAQGIGLVDIRTRFQQWLVHFGTLFFLAASLIAASFTLRRVRLSSLSIVAVAASVAGALWVLAGGLMREAPGGGDAAQLTGATSGVTAAVLFLSVGAAVVAAIELWRAAFGDARAPLALDSPADAPAGSDEPAGTDEPAAVDRLEARSGLVLAVVFGLLCVAIGLALPLATEFVFLRDLFGRRMNTIFKFYYQAWVLLSLGGALAWYVVWRRAHPVVAWAWSALAVVLVAGGLAYPAMAFADRTRGRDVSTLTLDGLAYWEDARPDDLEAARWLRANAEPGSTILETYGGAYGHEGRISMATGLPTVLGWEGHEHQWRGTRDEIDPRKTDIETLYGTRSEAEWRDLITRYGVDYVIVGDEERSKFGLTPEDEARLASWMTPVFEARSGRLTIFEP